MEHLYTLIAGLVIGAGGMYFVCRNNIKKLGRENELLKEAKDWLETQVKR